MRELKIKNRRFINKRNFWRTKEGKRNLVHGIASSLGPKGTKVRIICIWERKNVGNSCLIACLFSLWSNEHSFTKNDRYELVALRWESWGNPLVVQWLKLHAFTAEGVALILGWGTKILQVVWLGQKNKTKNKQKDFLSYFEDNELIVVLICLFLFSPLKLRCCGSGRWMVSVTEDEWLGLLRIVQD